MTFQVTGMTGDTYNTKDFMKVISLFYFHQAEQKQIGIQVQIVILNPEKLF
jgi:hypothetical protein